ncbi:MAG: cytochrome c oxidase subunit II [Prolixibacteraceae bacterium]|jgi:cytochrome c oxidase subunit 2|nr:cytochrome c oxidase subunit II [Prolixibacteraceae bacterium]
MYILANTTHASNMVEGVDKAFLLILGVSFFFLIGLTIVMLVFIYKYNRKRNPQATQIKGSNTLEIVWTVIPTILVLIMFYYGWAGWKPMTKAPEDSFHITVNSRMWNFTFEYENGKKTDTLFIPKDKPIKLNLRSMDVIHSVYIPAFRVKQDVVPGTEKFMWFVPQKEGIYELFCTEYCGLQHSYMYNWVKVMPEEDFNKWYVDTTKKAIAVVDSPTASGKRIMTNIGCFACHSLDGSKLVGPSFKGIYGSERTVITGKEKRQAVADDEYIHRAIFDPNADIVEGFSKGMMLPYTNQLSEEDVKLIIEYLKTL